MYVYFSYIKVIVECQSYFQSGMIWSLHLQVKNRNLKIILIRATFPDFTILKPLVGMILQQ